MMWIMDGTKEGHEMKEAKYLNLNGCLGFVSAIITGLMAVNDTYSVPIALISAGIMCVVAVRDVIAGMTLKDEANE